VLAAGVETIPLYPRRRLVGSAFGGFASVRRGEGSDVASSRPYEPGDHFKAIDWKSSARLSSAHGSDEFIVRERHSEEMPRVVIVVDRRPEMSLYAPELPWLHKPTATRAAVALLVASALNQRALVGYLDFGSHEGESEAGDPFWRAPRAQVGVWQGDLRERIDGFLGGGFDAPEDTLERSLAFLSRVRGLLPMGTFVFVVSDFTVPLSPASWARAIDHGWDVVPVIVQDPVWEQSFPEISGVVTPLADPLATRFRQVRLGAREVEERRLANETRIASLRSDFLGLGLDAVSIDVGEGDAVRHAFLAWTEGRVALRGGRA
jgi:uncharacterized protein (DUF58 family)